MSMKNVKLFLSIDVDEYDKSLHSFCKPNVGDMKSTNAIDAKRECSNSPSCYMFYQHGNDETTFRSCENTAEIHVSSIGSILYQKKGNKIFIADSANFPKTFYLQ